MIDAPSLERHSGEASELLSAMANRKRLLILCNLARGEMQVGALAEKVDLSQSALSQHLAKLRGMHLVTTRREAQTIYYTLESAAVRQMLKALETLYSE